MIAYDEILKKQKDTNFAMQACFLAVRDLLRASFVLGGEYEPMGAFISEQVMTQFTKTKKCVAPAGTAYEFKFSEHHEFSNKAGYAILRSFFLERVNYYGR